MIVRLVNSQYLSASVCELPASISAYTEAKGVRIVLASLRQATSDTQAKRSRVGVIARPCTSLPRQTGLQCAHSFFDAGRARRAKRGGLGRFLTAQIEQPLFYLFP